MKYSHIAQVSVLGSSICNLNCSYCYLHEQHYSNAYGLLNQEIQQSWIDGTYAQNIRRVFKEIECDPLEVQRFEIWGGEPLIQLENLTKSIGDIAKLFPNLTFFLIPTNWQLIKEEELMKMLIEIDKNLTPRRKNKQKLQFHLQLSIDGPPGDFMTQGHPGKWEIYKKNIINCCKQFSENQLNNIEIIFEVHPTASKEVIFKNFSNTYDIGKYITYMQNFVDFINNTIEEYNVDYAIKAKQTIAPLVAVPAQMTVEDGAKIEELYRISEYAQYLFTEDLKFGQHLYHHFTHCVNPSSVINQNGQCAESGLYGLMINPDGTITECACSYIQHKEEYLKSLLAAGKDEEYRVSMLRNRYFFNPIGASDKEKEEFDWYVLNGLRDTESTQISLTMAMVQELALSRQVDYSYYLNPEKLLKHATACAMIYSCTREHLNESKIPFLCSINDCRRHFNGGVSFINDSRIEEGKYKIEMVLNNVIDLE